MPQAQLAPRRRRPERVVPCVFSPAQPPDAKAEPPIQPSTTLVRLDSSTSDTEEAHGQAKPNYIKGECVSF